jgi:hypothetical protein
MVAPARRVLMVGLPETGKTTFLAAFWYLVERGDLEGALRLVRLPDIRKYLEQIKTDWLMFRKPARTVGSMESITENSMRLSSANGDEFDLSFPDVLGEIFREQVEHRSWEPSFADLVKTTAGLVLFVHPKNLKKGPSIAFANEVLDGWQDQPEMAAESDGAAEEKAPAVLWEPALMPTQVKLVDIIQTLCGLFGEGRQIDRLAIVISAWDLVRKEGLDPHSWVDKHLPLLTQYLRCNQQTVQYRIFGVSAQGGDLAKDVDKLHSVEHPTNRILIEGLMEGEGRNVDLTFPVRWVLGNADQRN